jgi:hypothetical protein
MAEASIAAVVLLPLGLLAFTALYLLRLGMTAGELTEAARQRLAGLGVLLLYLVIVLAVSVCFVGIYCLLRVSRIA